MSSGKLSASLQAALAPSQQVRHESWSDARDLQSRDRDVSSWEGTVTVTGSEPKQKLIQDSSDLTRDRKSQLKGRHSRFAVAFCDLSGPSWGLAGLV